MRENILNIAGLKVAYGGIKAVKGIDLRVDRGELVTLIGANGAGKTTTLKAVANLLRAERGDTAEVWRERMFELIEGAQRRGVDVTCDRYPYTAANTGLAQVMPRWALEGSKDEQEEK